MADLLFKALLSLRIWDVRSPHARPDDAIEEIGRDEKSVRDIASPAVFRSRMAAKHPVAGVNERVVCPEIEDGNDKHPTGDGQRRSSIFLPHASHPGAPC